MSYEAQEASQEDGAPFFLYTFAAGATSTRYTSRETAFAFTASPGTVYTPAPFGHTNVRTSPNFARNEITLEFPASDTFAQARTQRGAAQATLTIQRVHATDAAEEAVTIWKGFVKRAVRRRPRIVITATPLSDRVRRFAQALRLQRKCPWSQFGGDTPAGGPCTLNAAAFETTVSVTAITGRVLTIPDLASAPEGDAYYLGGQLDYQGQKRKIEAYDRAGTTITLLEDLPDLTEDFATSPPVNVKIAPGCQQEPTVCDAVFDNLAECGAATELPTREVFGGLNRIDQG